VVDKVMASIDTHLVLRLSDLPNDILRELRNRFTRANPKFFKSQNMGYSTWGMDSKVMAWEEDEQFLYLPRGAVESVQKIISAVDLEMDIRDRTISKSAAGLKFIGKLRPYQIPAVDDLINQKYGGILRGPPGSGKTIILLGAIVKLDRPTIVVVHNVALMDQWREKVGEFLGIAPGNIGGGRKEIIRPVTIAMQKSLWSKMKKPPSWVKNFEVVVADEVHRFASRTFNAVASMFAARLRIGASADERRKDGMEWLTRDTFGPVVHEISKSDLIGLKRLVPVEMDIHATEYIDGLYLDSVSEGESPDWVGMINRLVDDKDRNRHILRVVLDALDDPGARVLMLSERVVACRDWVDVFRSRGIEAGLLIGGSVNKRELARTKAGLQTGRVRVGLGTTVADEGLDIPALTHVVLTCPVHSHPKRLEQMVGRCARPWDNKTVGRAVYFWDQMMFPPWPADEVEKRKRAEATVIKRLASVVSSIRFIET
jgi:superfamily II DNA or RNA helicase